MKNKILSKNDFNYKLMKFVLGEQNIPMYNYCPYFWLSILSYFIWPFSLIVKFFNYVNKKIIFIFNMFLFYIKNKNYNKFILSDDNLILGWFSFYYTRKYNGVMIISDENKSKVNDNYSYFHNHFKKWWENGNNPEKNSYMDKILSARCLTVKEKQDEILKMTTKKPIFTLNRMVNVSKTIFYSIIWLFIGFTILLFILYINKHYIFSLDNLIFLLTMIGLVIIICLFVIGIIFCIFYLCNFYIPNIYDNSKFEKNVNKIHNKLSLLYKMIVSWKEDNCPGIEWKQDKK